MVGLLAALRQQPASDFRQSKEVGLQYDLKQLPDGHAIDCELCIVGAGAAGITIAKELAGTDISVCLLESGSLEWEDDTQALYAGKISGTLPPRDPLESRLRYFGGTTNHWAGCCMPLNEIDFETRSWVPDSGWPINRSDIDTYYRRAQDYCELGAFEYGETLWNGLDVKALAFDRDRIVTRFFQESPPTNFAEVHGPTVLKANNIQTIINANVLGFNASDSGREITYIDIAALNGKRGRVTAKYFVLACGGIENARLLLLSDNHNSNGLGNDHDLVGRYYNDHLYSRLGFAWSAIPNIWQRHGLSEHDHEASNGWMRPSGDPVMIRPIASLSDTWQRKMGVLDIGVMAEEPEEDDETFPAARKNQPELRHRVSLVAQSETAPNRDSRVKLGSDRDALGQRRPSIDWRLSKIDMHTQETMAHAFGSEVTRLGIARMRVDDWIQNQDWTSAMGRENEPLSGNAHHMGTTRMADDPTKGVVDKDCVVHGIANFYIAGSSVFPSSGFANPTLTIVALALRTADTLKKQLK